MLKDYYHLTKPGITVTNTLTAIAGYLFATHWQIDWPTLLGLTLGVYLLIASACVVNNYIDRNIDIVMKRTSLRALAAGRIKPAVGLSYGIVLGLVGLWLLICLTSWLVVILGVIAYIDYVALYGYSKRHTVHGTLIGTICGGASLVAGYAAGSGQLDVAAGLLFLIMLAWQMPHFYAIAIRNLKDYRKAGIVILPAVKGMRRTKLEMTVYGTIFAVSPLLLTLLGDAGWVFATLLVLPGLYWLWLIVGGFKTSSDNEWAKQVFMFSLILILIIPVAVALGPVLP